MAYYGSRDKLPNKYLMINIAATDLNNIRIPGGFDIDTVHQNPDLQCINVHCWVLSNDGKFVLIQKRAADTWCYPDKYDISLAGHVDGDELPQDAILRETQEEGLINLDHRLIIPDGPIPLVEKGCTNTGKDWSHNQLVYLYFATIDPLELTSHPTDVDIGTFEWWSIDSFALRATNPTSLGLVPHPDWYFQTVIKKLYELSRLRATMAA